MGVVVRIVFEDGSVDVEDAGGDEDGDGLEANGDDVDEDGLEEWEH